MANCLGIYFDDNIVKYAKLAKNNSGTIEIKEHGIRFVTSNIKDTLQKIIADTSSEKDSSIVLSAPKVEYNAFQVFRQISNNDLQSIVKLEFEDWCEKKTVGSANLTYVYSLSSAVMGDYHRGVMGICAKNTIEEFSSIGETKVSAMYPAELLLHTDVPKDEKNYILVNLDKNLSVTVVINEKVVYTTLFEIGMGQIFEKFMDILGSYQKAYEACKQFNVFSDAESDTNKVQLEEIVEPILQEVLRDVAEDVNRHKDNINKIFVTGSSTLFTNIDTLFTEYFNIRCEILKPDFVTDVGGVRNIAEVLEVLPAVAVAKEYLLPETTGLEFLRVSTVKENFFKKLFEKKKPGEVKEKPKADKKQTKINIDVLPKFNKDKLTEYMMYPVIVCFLAIVAYIVFSNVYMNQVTKMKEEINSKISKYDEMTSLTKADKRTIDASTSQYKAINDEVSDIRNRIETNQIGKFSTYNVAAFTQKLIKIIPKNVQLKTISSDDNKKVKIVAESSQYPSLGYFVASLRLQPDILSNVTINSITNGDVVSIEIGGDLP